MPIPVPTALSRSTTPNIHAGSFDDLSTNAAKNVKKPTVARSNPIAVPAATMLRARSASRSSAVSDGPTRSARGIPSAATIPIRKIRVAVRNTHGAPASCRIPAASGPATMPPRMLMNASRELASTSSPLFLMTPGTSALLVTRLRLRQHERPERERIQGQAVDVRGHDQAQHGSAGHRRREQQASPPAGAVDHRAEDRRDERKRRQGEHEVEERPSGALGRSWR